MTITIFITGTSTDIGKTFVANEAVRELLMQQKKVAYWKPVQTGLTTDAAVIQKAHGPAVTILESLAHYPDPLSPDQAAVKAQREPVTVTQLLKAYRELPSFDYLIIEGAGGLLVPLNQLRETWLDFLQLMPGHKLWLVASSGLGTLNHTGLSLKVLKNAGLNPDVVIFNGPKHHDNEASLLKLYPGTRLVDSAAKALTLAPQGADDLTTEWETFDHRHVWHPYTQHQTEQDPISISRAKGSYLYTTDGRELIDGIGSWWVNTIGHGRVEIAEALHAQQQTLDHCLFAGTRHRPAAVLAERMLSKAGLGFAKVFYSDNGSTAVEVAIKMLAQGALQRGETKRRLLVALNGGYHGDTFGAMAAGFGSGFFQPFAPYLFETLRIDPVTSHPSQMTPKPGKLAMAAALEQWAHIVKERHHEMLGLILEPLLQGAGGMLMQDPEWLKGLVTIAQQHGIPVIVDEVFSGMGRLGQWFACQKAGIKPEILCLAKGLTGGAVPLAMTLCAQGIFNDFLAPSKDKALLHGHSFTANPIACAAALKTLSIYESEGLLERAQEMESIAKAWLKQEAMELGLIAPRVLGSVMAFEWGGSPQNSYFHAGAKPLVLELEKAGLFVRPLGNTIYLCPPLTIEFKIYINSLRIIKDSIVKLKSVK